MFRSPSRGRPEDTAGDAAKASAIKNASVLHSGRGGVGNVRSPSRDPTDRLKLREAQEKETHIQEDYLREEAKHTHSSGRGGIGNRTRDESQERGRGRGAEKDTGGGSVGNVSVAFPILYPLPPHLVVRLSWASYRVASSETMVCS
jgi:Protein of unknown function (DUF3602)